MTNIGNFGWKTTLREREHDFILPKGHVTRQINFWELGSQVPILFPPLLDYLTRGPVLVGMHVLHRSDSLFKCLKNVAMCHFREFCLRKYLALALKKSLVHL